VQIYITYVSEEYGFYKLMINVLQVNRLKSKTTITVNRTDYLHINFYIFEITLYGLQRIFMKQRDYKKICLNLKKWLSTGRSSPCAKEY
jgi:hypothetical protein